MKLALALTTPRAPLISGRDLQECPSVHQQEPEAIMQDSDIRAAILRAGQQRDRTANLLEVKPEGDRLILVTSKRMLRRSVNYARGVAAIVAVSSVALLSSTIWGAAAIAGGVVALVSVHRFI